MLHIHNHGIGTREEYEMNILAEKELRYLLRFMDEYIESMLYSVLEDSFDQPEYSAVTAHNLIKCYMKVLNDCKISCNFSSAREYMIERCFSMNEIESFEQKRRAEAEYYVGEQY